MLKRHSIDAPVIGASFFAHNHKKQRKNILANGFKFGEACTTYIYSDFKEVKQMKKLMVLCSATVLAAPALAMEEPEKGPVSGEASLTYIVNNGNTEGSTFGGRIKAVHEGAHWRTTGRLEGTNQKTDDLRTGEKYFAGVQLDRKLDDVSYVFGALEHVVDRFSGFEYQTSAAFGYGRTVINNDQHKLTFEVGPGYRISEVRSSGDTEEDAFLRAGLDYEWQVSENTLFVQDLVVDAAEESTVIKSLTALKTKLNNQMSLTVGYDLRKDSEAPAGTDKTDTTFYTALDYGF